MTIALGLWCDDGIVLCADSQVTVLESDMKYPAKKIHTMRYKDWVVSLVYAGSPDLMRLVHEKMYPKLLQLDSNSSEWEAGVRRVLEQVMKDVCTQHKKKNIELLCAATTVNGSKALWLAKRALVTDSELAECLGVGESPLHHFLADLFVRPRMSVADGLVLGCYMVSKAITYINGCDGPIQATVIYNDGTFSELNASVWEEPAKLQVVEGAISDLFHSLRELHEASRERQNEIFAAFRKELGDLHWPEERDYILHHEENKAKRQLKPKPLEAED